MASPSMEPSLQQEPVIGSSIFMATRGPVELLPNPDFVFPARSDTSAIVPRQTSITRRPRSEQNLAARANGPTHRNRASVSALPLPSFSFNPAGSSADSTSVQSTPPLSPSLNSPPTPSRTRHKRGGSELIGDDRVTGSVNIIASSPKISGTNPSPASINLGPPAGRRHAHRRSGAISCHDLASIMQAKDSKVQARSGSAPTSPLNVEDQAFNFSVQTQHTPRESLSSISLDDTSSSDTASTPRRSLSRARVGFAERVEYIRPLSTISSETESSMSTIRGHSVNGSWSSVASANNLSPARRCRPSLDTTFEDDDTRRPNTSQAVLTSPNSSRFLYDLPPTVEERPKSEAGLLTACIEKGDQPKRKGFSWWDSKTKRPHTEQTTSTADSHVFLRVSPPPSPRARHSLDSDQETVKNTRMDSDRRKPRKVKSWAHSLIARKHKPKKEQRPATPPATSTKLGDEDDEDSLDSHSDSEQSTAAFDFDQDNTITLIDETTQLQHSCTQPQASHSVPSSLSAFDNSGPVIDLDVAMSPLRDQMSPTGRGPRQARSRQSMHSATMTSGAFNFASQHRRTESAPQLKPFEGRSVPSFTATAMPDVFEEEDEELEDDKTGDLHKPSIASLWSPQSNNSYTAPDGESRMSETKEMSASAGTWPSISGFGKARRQKSGASASESGSRPTSLAIETVENISQPECDSAVDLKIIEVDDVICSPDLNEDRVGTPLSDYKLAPPPPLKYSIPMPSDQVMTPGTASDASAYSPFFSPSQASLVGPRIETGASSINEAASFCFGEPGPELRISVDDVPSLSSSRSTMTSPAMHGGLPGSAGGAAPSIYSVRSATTTDFTRQKRGSIASLSRLVTDRFERSKLSIETRPVTSSADSTIKVKKTKHRHRLSKLVQFWRSKETV